jgi:hypothetical protein
VTPDSLSEAVVSSAGYCMKGYRDLTIAAFVVATILSIAITRWLDQPYPLARVRFITHRVLTTFVKQRGESFDPSLDPEDFEAWHQRQQTEWREQKRRGR